MALSLSSSANALSVVKNGAPSTTASSSTRASWNLSGHDADVLGAATWGSCDSVFATCDAAGRSLIWQYRTDPSAVDSGDDADADDDDLLMMGMPGIRPPCRNVCVLHSGGPAVLDICFLTHRPWLVGAQGNNAVSVWDVTRGECVHTFHRRSEPGSLESGEAPASRRTAGRRRQRSRETAADGALPPSYQHQPPPPPSPWPVLNCVMALPAHAGGSSSGGGQTVCYGGDDGYVVLYDIRSQRVEMSLRLNVPITAMCSAAGSDTSDGSSAVGARGDQVYVGDAAGSVRWLDVRALSRSKTLAEVWLGKTVVSDLIVPKSTPKTAESGRADYSAAAIALTSGSETSHSLADVGAGTGDVLPSAVWLDMKPFVTSDDQRIRSRLSLSGGGSSGRARAAGNKGSSGYFWRGDASDTGLLGFPMLPCPSSSSTSSMPVGEAAAAQLVQGGSKFMEGAWKRLHCAEAAGGAARGASHPEASQADRRVVRFISGATRACAGAVEGPFSSAAGAPPAASIIRLLATSGKEVVLYEEKKDE